LHHGSQAGFGALWRPRPTFRGLVGSSIIEANRGAWIAAPQLNANQVIERLTGLGLPEHVKKAQRYLDPGLKDYGDVDVSIGARMGDVFALAKEFTDMPLDEVEVLLESPDHEVRVGAVSIMDFQARNKRTPLKRRKELFDLYIRRHDRINTLDLVDRGAPYVVGGYLFDGNDDHDLIHKAVGWVGCSSVTTTRV